jgi:hypothetical protein
VASYTRDVEAFLRVSARKGLKHKPATIVEVMLLRYEQNERQIQALEGIEDALRLRVRCSLLLVCMCLTSAWQVGLPALDRSERDPLPVPGSSGAS